MNDNEVSRGQDLLHRILFLAAGILITIYGVLAMRNDVPIVLWAASFILGPILLLIGGVGIYRALGDRSNR